jgi:hypothetical protein
LLKKCRKSAEISAHRIPVICEHGANAQHIDKIYHDHSNWNRVPYCLSLDGTSGIDHTNPSSWTGDVISGHVNLYAAWMQGQSEATALLKWAGALFEFDPKLLTIESPEINLMRPNGRYPGIQVDTIEPKLQPIALSELSDNPGTAESIAAVDTDTVAQ